MKIERIQPSKHKKGRVLVFLSDGAMLKVTEQELLDFALCPGAELEEAALARLKEAAGVSDVKSRAAALIGRRAMSRRDLEGKLLANGASAPEARAAADWLEDIGALDDAQYAALLIRHCADLGYGPARCREELRRHGIDHELWEEALAEAPSPADLAERYLRTRFQGGLEEEASRRRAAGALARRGFDWAAVKEALRRLEE